MWIGSDLVVNLLDVVRVTDQHVLVDELRPKVAPLPGAAAHRKRSLVLLLHPGAAPRGPERRLHAAGAGWDRGGAALVDPDSVAAEMLQWLLTSVKYIYLTISVSSIYPVHLLTFSVCPACIWCLSHGYI